jgi:hypothetical protein
MSQKTLERLEYLRKSNSKSTLGDHRRDSWRAVCAERCQHGSAGRGWCSWTTKTWPLTRQRLNQKVCMVMHRKSCAQTKAKPELGEPKFPVV